MTEAEKNFMISDHFKRWSALNVKILRIMFVLSNCNGTKDLQNHVYLKEYLNDTHKTKEREKKSLSNVLKNLAI